MNSILFTCIYWMNIMLNDSCARGTMLNRGQKGQVLFLLACVSKARNKDQRARLVHPRWPDGSKTTNAWQTSPFGEFLHTHRRTFSSSNGCGSRGLLASLWLLWARFNRVSWFPTDFICRLQAMNLGPFGKWNLYAKLESENFQLVKFLHEHKW